MGPSLITGSGGEMGYETDHGKRRGQGATTAAFYLGLCRLRGILFPPASAMAFCRRAIVIPRSYDGAAGGPFFFAAKKIRIGRRHRCYNASDSLQRFPILALKSRIDARKRA